MNQPADSCFCSAGRNHTGYLPRISLPGTSSLSRRAGELRGNFGLHPELLLSHLENLDAAILLGGHSHKQEQREYAEKTYLNPGSLGLALDGVGGHAHFAILTLENSTWQIECFQIPYDLEATSPNSTAPGWKRMAVSLPVP